MHARLRFPLVPCLAATALLAACDTPTPTAPVEDVDAPVARSGYIVQPGPGWTTPPASLPLLRLQGGPAPAGIDVVLDFESLAGTGDGFTSVSPYVEDGYVLAAAEAGFVAPHPQSRFYSGRTALFLNQIDGTTHLSREDGGVFTLVSIDLAEIALFGPRPAEVTFVGRRADGTTVSETVSMDGQAGFETFSFSSLTGIVEVTWKQAGWDNFQPHHFDDVVLRTAPLDKAGCENGGWEAYGFKNQGQCVRVLMNGKDQR